LTVGAAFELQAKVNEVPGQLGVRLAPSYKQGALFAKWRAVIRYRQVYSEHDRDPKLGSWLDAQQLRCKIKFAEAQTNVERASS
jgi:hypothetical protein